MRTGGRPFPSSVSRALLVLAAVASGPAALAGAASPHHETGQEDRALELLREAGRSYEEIDAFCAGFRQEMVVPLLERVTRSRGILCQERPDRFSMRFTEPEGDVIVADGEYFWVYYPSADPGQVIRFTMASRPGGMDFQREFLEDPGEKYELEYLGRDEVAGRSTHLIRARPRGPSTFVRARIWLDPARSLIRQVELALENGSVRTVTLGDFRMDPEPDPDRFTFTPPPGAQVIPRGEGR